MGSFTDRKPYEGGTRGSKLSSVGDQWEFVSSPCLSNQSTDFIGVPLGQFDLVSSSTFQ
jgi:hypothetical protein